MKKQQHERTAHMYPAPEILTELQSEEWQVQGCVPHEGLERRWAE
jgi:hypothetical protein